MGTLARIHHSQEISLPRPVCEKPGDVFKVVRFSIKPPLNMLPGALFVYLVGAEREGWLHVLETEHGLLLARLFFLNNWLRADVRYLHDFAVSGIVKYKSLKIRGCVTEAYPTGDPAIRIVSYEEGLIYSPSLYKQVPYLVPSRPQP